MQLSEVDYSASTPLDSSIVFSSELTTPRVSVVFYSSYNCCVALLQPGKGLSFSFSSSELDAALVV